jgi:GlpG protein
MLRDMDPASGNGVREDAGAMTGAVSGPAPVVQADAPPAAPRPYVTYAVITACVLICAELNLASGPERAEAQFILYPSAPQIWRGAVWGLVTSAFAHVAIWHLVFNVWWARDFGRVLEPDFGRWRYGGFILLSAAVASSWQLLTTNTTGIGFSGVVYAMFGYALARRGSRKAYAALLRPQTIRWLLGWAALCVALTIAKVWTVANAAHLAGLASGWLLGIALEKPGWRRAALAGGVVLAAGLVLSLTYMPWSALWRDRGAAYVLDSLRMRAEAGDARAQDEYASMLMHWPETREKGLQWCLRSAEAGDTQGMNDAAWWLATAREEHLRNGPQAVQWAEKARAQDSSAYIDDTLAAAYAETDRWDDALEAEHRALESVSEKARPIFEKHRQSYERHEKWRE